MKRKPTKQRGNKKGGGGAGASDSDYEDEEEGEGSSETENKIGKRTRTANIYMLPITIELHLLLPLFHLPVMTILIALARIQSSHLLPIYSLELSIPRILMSLGLLSCKRNFLCLKKQVYC